MDAGVGVRERHVPARGREKYLDIRGGWERDNTWDPLAIEIWRLENRESVGVRNSL